MTLSWRVRDVENSLHATSFPAVDLTIQGTIIDIDRFATHDGPGIRTAIFLKGCPLRCIWCHSPESQAVKPELLFRQSRCTGCGLCLDACPEGAIAPDPYRVNRDLCTGCGGCVEVCYPGALTLAGRRVTVGELTEDVARDTAFFDSSGGGVTVTGGEPAAQPRFTVNTLLEFRRRGIHTAVETTGFTRWDTLEAIASAADLVMYDVKLADDEMHRRHVGSPNTLILENLDRLAASHDNVVVRVPCIPGVNDAPEQIADLARFVAGVRLERIVLLPYNGAAGAKYEWMDREFALRDRETQSDEHMEQLAAACRREGLCPEVGG